MSVPSHIKVNALRAFQGETPVYSLFLRGDRVLEVADIARVQRSKDGKVSGFQRPEIRAHVRGIVRYLDGTDVLFPNSIVLAMASDVEFKEKRGTKNAGVEATATAGVLKIPVRAGRKSLWIVDGQQRAIALSKSCGGGLPVPVTAFASHDIAVHREQFILVNKARPLDRRLIDELLPGVQTSLPRELARRRVPSALCAALNDTPGSPFHCIVRRPSYVTPGAVVTDSSLTGMIRTSLEDPRGALAAHSEPDGAADIDAMFDVMVSFWSAVRETFPEAWGLPPERSRLMHAAGIAAMGVLMDQVMSGVLPGEDGRKRALVALSRIAPHCRWTGGRWEAIDREWDDVQHISKDVRALSNLLVSLERRAMLDFVE